MRLLLKNYQCPGDLLMLGIAVRDLKKSHPEYAINVSTSCDYLFENNPWIDRSITERNADRVIKCEYPLIHNSTGKPWHFIHGFRMFLEDALQITIPQGDMRCDVHLTEFEKNIYSDLPKNTWLIDSGGKTDFTNKIWEFDRFQQVVDATKDNINWVQIGELHHNHRPLAHVTDMRGKTAGRGILALMYQASGVLTAVSFPMHLSTMTWRYGINRPCVVIAGGREPSTWEQYQCHQYIHNCGCYDCNKNGACWKSRVVPLKDGSDKDLSICEHPVRTASGQVIPLCMDAITVDDVVRRIYMYL